MRANVVDLARRVWDAATPERRARMLHQQGRPEILKHCRWGQLPADEAALLTWEAANSRCTPVAGCKGCESGEPVPHFASYACESGGRDHCTCDTCF